jgi:hypothetical protein
VLVFAVIGKLVGGKWEQWRHHLQILDYLVVAAIVGLAIYWVVQRRRKSGPGDGETGREEEPPTPQPANTTEV